EKKTGCSGNFIQKKAAIFGVIVKKNAILKM
ncbi:MAG: hypothetical protein ACI9UT_003576, partial [Flavobacteriales bacterium]